MLLEGFSIRKRDKAAAYENEEYVFSVVEWQILRALFLDYCRWPSTRTIRTDFPASQPQGIRPTAIPGKMPRTKIRNTMIHMATRDSLLTGIGVASAGAGCQYIAFTTFK